MLAQPSSFATIISLSFPGSREQGSATRSVYRIYVLSERVCEIQNIHGDNKEAEFQSIYHDGMRTVRPAGLHCQMGLSLLCRTR